VSTNKIAYQAAQTLSNALASLASSSGFTSGYESAVVDNTTNLFLDYELRGKVTVGTTPTVGTEIRVYVVPTVDDGTTWPDVFDGTESAETVTSLAAMSACWRLAAVLPVDSATSNRPYEWFCGSVAQLFGGAPPSKFVLFTTHNTGVALNATGANQVTQYRGVYSTVA
jgi:hypothetical protein